MLRTLLQGVWVGVWGVYRKEGNCDMRGTGRGRGRDREMAREGKGRGGNVM